MGKRKYREERMSVVEYLLSDSFAWIFLAFIAGEIIGEYIGRKKEKQK